ncbi:large ribosomal subunit protein mL64 [Phaenicophaeus curvirostris]|uniref:large ribosomal subunit protein mL64 n=1 Tax=Phaenicophaeus curvirostris TaxID=33595 RepID=UPI0037F0A443
MAALALQPRVAALLAAAPARSYRAAPLRKQRGSFRPDPADPREAARRFGRFGAAAVGPEWRPWGDPEQLRRVEAEEREREAERRQREEAEERRLREEARRREERQARVARELAAMPGRIAAWREQRAQARAWAAAEAARRQRLLAQAGLGGPRDAEGARAQALLQDLERQQRQDEKRRRRQERQEAARGAMAAAQAAAAPRPPGAPPEPQP